MSISVISSPAALSQTIPGTGPADAAAPGGFAGLLSLQLADLFGQRPDAPAKDEGEDSLLVATEGAIPADPSIVPLTPPVEQRSERSLIVDPGVLSGREKRDPAPLPVAAGLQQAAATRPNGAPLDNTAISLPNENNAAGKAANIAASLQSTVEAAPSAFAGLLSPQASAAAQPAVAHHTPAVASPLGDARWPQELGNQIVWLAKNDQQAAQINITPAQLGPIQISLNMNGDQATAVFASPHAEVRQAIEEALPRLREMLAGAGIELGQANVGAQLAKDNRPQTQPEGPRFSGDNAILRVDSGLSANAATHQASIGRGLVDLFA